MIGFDPMLGQRQEPTACPHCGQLHPEQVLLCPVSEKLMPLVGRVLDGKFRFLKQLGEGGMGAVWMCENILVRKTVAIKLMHVQFSRDEGVLARFRNEATAAGRIGSKHICDILDLGKSDLGPYIVMEMLTGSDFAGYVQKNAPIAQGLAVFVIRQALLGLRAAHEVGIIHRDLKPENIFMHQPEPGRLMVKLMDFGISKFTEGSDAGKTGMGVLMGTPEYMSPEQTEGAAKVDARTDIWAIGVILYWALSGRNPFSGPTMASTLMNVAMREPAALQLLAPQVDPGLASLIHRAIQKVPDHRFASANDFYDALAPYEQLEGLPFVPYASASAAAILPTAPNLSASPAAQHRSSVATPSPGNANTPAPQFRTTSATPSGTPAPQYPGSPGTPAPQFHGSPPTPAPQFHGSPATPAPQFHGSPPTPSPGASGPTFQMQHPASSVTPHHDTFSSELRGTAQSTPTLDGATNWDVVSEGMGSPPQSNIRGGKGTMILVAVTLLALVGVGGYFAYARGTRTATDVLATHATGAAVEPDVKTGAKEATTPPPATPETSTPPNAASGSPPDAATAEESAVADGDADAKADPGPTPAADTGGETDKPASGGQTDKPASGGQTDKPAGTKPSTPSGGRTEVTPKNPPRKPTGNAGRNNTSDDSKTPPRTTPIRLVPGKPPRTVTTTKPRTTE